MNYKLLSAAALALLPLAAAAYKLDDVRWARGETVFHIDFAGQSPSGISWSEAFEDAMAEWNERTAFRFDIVPEYRDPCAGYHRNDNADNFPAGGGDSFNGADFGDSMCGNELGKGVAAVTLMISTGGFQGFSNIAQTDIIFNSDFDWDIFNGQAGGVDFRRTALHELGHAMGLGHEESEPAIMAPRLSGIDRLQPDDILGANAIYGLSGNCVIEDIPGNTVIDGRLESGDCAMFELYNLGNDTSFVDTYRLSLARDTHVSLLMESSELDPVIIVTNEKLEPLHMEDDEATGSCNARVGATLPAGDYLILANTYVDPQKCAGNTGAYRLTVSEQFVVSTALSLSGQPASALFSGGASSGGVFGESFGPDEPIDVSVEIRVPPEHVGQSGSLFVMAVLEDGRRFVKNPAGQFERVRGGVDSLAAFRENVLLDGVETLEVLNGFRGANVVSGKVAIYVGYALGNTREIIHNREPVRFTIE